MPRNDLDVRSGNDISLFRLQRSYESAIVELHDVIRAVVYLLQRLFHREAFRGVRYVYDPILRHRYNEVRERSLVDATLAHGFKGRADLVEVHRIDERPREEEILLVCVH